MPDLSSRPTHPSVYLLTVHPNWRESRVNRRLLAAALDLSGVTVCDLYASSTAQQRKLSKAGLIDTAR